MKRLGGIGFEIGNNRLDFSGDLDPNADPGIFLHVPVGYSTNDHTLSTFAKWCNQSLSRLRDVYTVFDCPNFLCSNKTTTRTDDRSYSNCGRFCAACEYWLLMRTA